MEVKKRSNIKPDMISAHRNEEIKKKKHKVACQSDWKEYVYQMTLHRLTVVEAKY